MRFQCGFVLLAALLVAADTPEEAIRAEKKKLEGVWNVESAEEEGKPFKGFKKGQIVFSGDKFTVNLDDQKEEGTYTIDPTKKPKRIDLTIKRPKGDEVALGVYELDGDTLRLIASGGSGTATTGGADGKVSEIKFETKRPEKVESKTGMLLTLKREKK